MDLVFSLAIAALFIISAVWSILERRAEKKEASLYLWWEDETPPQASSSDAIYTQIIRPEHYRHNPRNFDGNPRNMRSGLRTTPAPIRITLRAGSTTRTAASGRFH